MDFTAEQLLEIETQLSHPAGDMGLEIALSMNVSNKAMTSNAIALLDITKSEHVLEIGHGNCAHLPEILESADKVYFTGLEKSETMHTEASRINAHLVANNAARFILYDGNTIPFSEDEFDKIFTVNTLYFWDEPVSYLNEIYRVLKPNGVCIISFAKKEFMSQLPFVQTRFSLYGNEELQALVKESHFNSVTIEEREDKVMSDDGTPVPRKFGLAVLQKD